MAAGKSNKITLFLIIILVILLIFIFTGFGFNCDSSENFGQDPSSRVQAGWVAGPNYGYDPINHFAEQIDAMRSGNPIPVAPKLFSSRGKKSGPLENYKENHGPYTTKCVHNPDCLEGETCYAGTCIPADLEPYKNEKSLRESYKSEGSCKSCMTTEEFEMGH